MVCQLAKRLGSPRHLQPVLCYVQDSIEHPQVRVIDVTALLRQAVFDLGVLVFANFHPLRSTDLDLRSMPWKYFSVNTPKLHLYYVRQLGSRRREAGCAVVV